MVVTHTKKLAEVIASKIEQDIIERGWPTGEVLGSEPDLLERYDVSRGVLREAIRLVEHKQIGRMRRGPSGGLVVTAPDAGPVIDAVAVYVRYAQVTLDELFEARQIVEVAATERAAANLTEADLEALRAHLAGGACHDDADPHALHRHIGALTGNPAIELFSDVLTRLTALYVGSLTVSRASSAGWNADSDAAHDAIVEALVAGNPGLAGHRMGLHLEALGAFLRHRRASQTVLSALLGRNGSQSKMAEELARSIFRDVAERGWPTGEVLGSESALIERYDVSRAVLREAARLLEYHQIARMRRGPGGGLVVTEPGADAIAEAMTLYLEYQGITPAHLYEARSALELAAVDLAAAKLDDDGAAALRASLVAEREAVDIDLNRVSHELHVLIAELAGNRLLLLFLRILIRLSARHTPPRVGARSRASLQALAAEVNRTHASIVEAVIDRDPELARHRMQKHLAALVPWYA
ncbi:MAG: FCD domain-containing protein [Acidimicrobiales bacterium]